MGTAGGDGLYEELEKTYSTDQWLGGHFEMKFV
jgi:hypothetical protein